MNRVSDDIADVAEPARTILIELRDSRKWQKSTHGSVQGGILYHYVELSLCGSPELTLLFLISSPGDSNPLQKVKCINSEFTENERERLSDYYINCFLPNEKENLRKDNEESLIKKRELWMTIKDIEMK